MLWANTLDRDEFGIAAGNKRGACVKDALKDVGSCWSGCVLAGTQAHGLGAIPGTRRSPVEHAKPSAMRPRLATTSTISLTRFCSSTLSGFVQLARIELSRAENFCSTSGIKVRKC